VRVWVDRAPALDDWRDHSTGIAPYQFIRFLSAGPHEVWLDYYEGAGSAGVSLAWEKISVDFRSIFLPDVKR
jgi:hypothetical protein